MLHTIEHSARTHHEDHVRLACAHTVWSCRPDRAVPILEDALDHQRDVVRIHAQVLLNEFYRAESGKRAVDFLRERPRQPIPCTNPWARPKDLLRALPEAAFVLGIRDPCAAAEVLRSARRVSREVRCSAAPPSGSQR